MTGIGMMKSLHAHQYFSVIADPTGSCNSDGGMLVT